jgi:hypothetical protein
MTMQRKPKPQPKRGPTEPKTVDDATAILDAIGLRARAPTAPVDLAAEARDLDAIEAEMRRRGLI